ncbi:MULTISPECIES: hypothetical protein [Streptomyces]|uniref:hypothetical protein n=1 Tax=Streptomyces TaxID=1883 RepID=UPI0033F9D529
MELASSGEDVAARWRHDPEDAIALVQELVANGEFTEDEVLNDAVDSAVLTGLLTLQEVRTASDLESCPLRIMERAARRRVPR